MAGKMNPKVFKELVLGFAVIEIPNTNFRGEKRTLVHMSSIIASDDDFDGGYRFPDSDSSLLDIETSSRLVTVLPVPYPTYYVKGYDANGKSVALGYEYPGVPIPDWIEYLKDMLDENNFLHIYEDSEENTD